MPNDPKQPQRKLVKLSVFSDQCLSMPLTSDHKSALMVRVCYNQWVLLLHSSHTFLIIHAYRLLAEKYQACFLLHPAEEPAALNSHQCSQPKM